MFEQDSKAIFSQSDVNNGEIDEYRALTFQSLEDLSVVLTSALKCNTFQSKVSDIDTLTLLY